MPFLFYEPMRRFILICLFLFHVNLFFGQTYTISGHVKLFESGGKEGPVSVTLNGINLPTKTDHTGRYVFELTASQIRLGDSFSIGIRKDGWKVANPEKLKSQMAARVYVLDDIFLCKENNPESCNRAAIFSAPSEVQKAYLAAQAQLLESESKRDALFKEQSNDIVKTANEVNTLNTTIDSLRKAIRLHDETLEKIFQLLNEHILAKEKANKAYNVFERAKEEIIEGNYKRAIFILDDTNLADAFNEAILDGTEEIIQLALNNYLLKGRLHIMLKNYDDAYFSFSEAYKREDNNLGIVIEMADANLLRGAELNENIELFNDALGQAKRLEDSVILMDNLGTAYLLDGDNEKSTQYFRRSIILYEKLAILKPEEYLSTFISYKAGKRIMETFGTKTQNFSSEDQIRGGIVETVETIKFFNSHQLDDLDLWNFTFNLYIASDYMALQQEDSAKKYLLIAIEKVEKYQSSNYLYKPYIVNCRLLLAGFIDNNQEFHEEMDRILTELVELPLPDYNKMDKIDFDFSIKEDNSFISESDYLTFLLVAYNNIFINYQFNISFQLDQKIKELDLDSKYYELLKRVFLMGTEFDKVYYTNGLYFLASKEYEDGNYLKAIENIDQIILVLEVRHKMVPDFHPISISLAKAYSDKAHYEFEEGLKNETMISADKAIKVFDRLKNDENALLMMSLEDMNLYLDSLKDLKRKASRMD